MLRIQNGPKPTVRKFVPASGNSWLERVNFVLADGTMATADGLHVECPRSAKMAVLAALAPLGTRLLDVNIHEPSLEDVYFGLREQ